MDSLMEKLRRRGGGGGSGSRPSLAEWSKSLRLSMSDPSFTLPETPIPIASPLHLKSLARRFGLKFMALRGGAVYLSTEAFYLEIRENGERILHILDPEFVQTLPPGEDISVHLKGLLDLQPGDWKILSGAEAELKSLLGESLLPRVGGIPAKIAYFQDHSPLSLQTSTDHFILKVDPPIPISLEKIAQITNITSLEPMTLSKDPVSLMDLISPESPLFITLPDQRHCYFLTQHPNGALVSGIPFGECLQVPSIIGVLKQQALFNTLISSCSGAESLPDLEKSIMFEVSSLDPRKITVSFEHPADESIAALEIDLTDVSSLKTKMYTVSSNILIPEDLISKVLEKSLSLPITMRAIMRYHLKKQKSNLEASNQNTSTSSFYNTLNNRIYEEVKVEDDKMDASSLEKTNAFIKNEPGIPGYDNSSFQMQEGSLNAKGPQDVVYYPGAGICQPTAVTKTPSHIRQEEKETPSGNMMIVRDSSKKKYEDTIKPSVSITPVSESSVNPPLSEDSKKIGIEIIPLGGKHSPSKHHHHHHHRDIKRSLSEDDKRRQLKKDKKRRHPSPLDKAKSSSSSSSKKRALDKKVSLEIPSSKDKDKQQILIKSSTQQDSLKMTFKSKSPSSSPSSSSKSSPKSSTGSSSGSKYSSSSKSSSSLKHSSSSLKKRDKEKSEKEKHEEVKRLLGGGKLLNKTFQIPKISSSKSETSFESKKIPSLMSLQPSIYSKDSSNPSSANSSPRNSSPKYSPKSASISPKYPLGSSHGKSPKYTGGGNVTPPNASPGRSKSSKQLPPPPPRPGQSSLSPSGISLHIVKSPSPKPSPIDLTDDGIIDDSLLLGK